MQKKEIRFLSNKKLQKTYIFTFSLMKISCFREYIGGRDWLNDSSRESFLQFIIVVVEVVVSC